MAGETRRTTYDPKDLPEDPAERYKFVRELFRKNFYPIFRGEVYDSIIDLVDIAFSAGAAQGHEYAKATSSIIAESLIEAIGCTDEKLRTKFTARINSPTKEHLVETIKEVIKCQTKA